MGRCGLRWMKKLALELELEPEPEPEPEPQPQPQPGQDHGAENVVSPSMETST